MNLLHTRLTSAPWTTLVSLPANDPDLARAALDAGAHGLKVHINVDHFASGTSFGSLAEEKPRLQEILALAEAAGANVGIVPGAGGKFASKADFAELAAMGVDYFDAYPGDCPAWAVGQKHLGVMMAAFQGGNLQELAALESLGMTLCEASIMPHEEYGTPMTALDLARYRALRLATSVPIIVPSQKKLVPLDMAQLKAAGLNGVLIGAIVTGRVAASIGEATRNFVSAV